MAAILTEICDEQVRGCDRVTPQKGLDNFERETKFGVLPSS